MKLVSSLTAALPRACRLFLALCLCLTLACCTKQPAFRIGVSQCSSDDWRSKMNEEIMREAMLHDNVEVEIRSADDSNEKQIADIQYFADNGFDIIVAAPNEADALTPIIRKVYSSGKPVILFDRHINGDSYTAYQGADNVEIGRLAARMARNLGGESCRVVEIRGLKGSSPEIERHDGFHAAAAKLGFPVIGSGYGSWTAEGGRRAADSLLRLFPDANVIYAHNDRMAIAASEVAEALGRNDIKVIGIDAAPAIGIQAVKDGRIDATFLYPTAGAQLVQTALAILEGRPYERHLILPSPAAVDPSNAELLLLEDNALRAETGKLMNLKGQLDQFWEQHSLQTAVLYGAIAILCLFAFVIFLLVRAFWMHKRHRQETEAKNLELQRQRDELSQLYERLQEATASKLNFFTNVSHDLRTPLTLIADPVEQLARADNLSPKQQSLMQLADKNVKRLTRLVNQILDIRKYDNSRLNLNLSQVDLGAAVREWTSSFTNAAVKRHIGISTEIQPGPFVTEVDLEKIERVLFNLISNAFKFTPANGQITVGLHQEGQELVLSVGDTGCGIPEDDLRQIFDRFFKTDHINPNGSGIGLALSKVFVEMHGGRIEVTSEVGKGSLFEVHLPVRKGDAPQANLRDSVATARFDAEELITVEADEVDLPEDSPVALVIDDNADIRTLIKTELSDHYTVIQASSGAQGVRMASKYIPDLVVCDVMMPGMSGYDTCKALKEEMVTSHIPVLLLTACSQDEQRTEGYLSGADAYMSKPFDSRMLLARCESLVQNRKRINAAGDKPGHPHAADESARPSALPASDIDDSFYRSFVEVVDAEMGNSGLSVEDVAARLGLSCVQMYRKIKALTNYSPAELIRNLRLQRAARMLKTTDANISEVAYAVGFTAPNHFTKCYKQFFGELPSETQARTSKKV